MEVRILKERYTALTEILNEINLKVSSQDTDILFSKYNTVEELLGDINSFTIRLINDGLSALSDIYIFFAPTGSLQEISIANGWGNKFIELSNKVDEIINM